MSLYQRHRPSSFDEVIGNESCITGLKALLATEHPPHAYLFVGPTGCGKTTLGRIVAFELGCSEQDFEEKDSADFRGIDTIRQIRHNAYYKAFKGERRVWLLDEAHKLSNDAQNALLKGLEDPPPHAYYILCTTDPTRVIETVRSRCSIHMVERLRPDNMVKLLGKVCAKEGMSLSRSMLRAIAGKSSDAIMQEDSDTASCHPRYALNILEKIIAVAPEERQKTLEKATEFSIAPEHLAAVMLKRQGWKAVTNILDGKTDDDVEELRRGILTYCRKVLSNSSPDQRERAVEVMQYFHNPFWDSGLPGLMMACYLATK